MLPENGDEDKDRGYEDDCEGDLGNWAGRERLHFTLAAVAVFFFVPAGEGCEEKETDECEDNRYDAVFELVLYTLTYDIRDLH